MVHKRFCGFPEGAEVSPVPNLFFTAVMPSIQNIAELKVTLHVLWLISRRRGGHKFATYSELVSDPVLMNGIKGEAEAGGEILRHALHLAVEHGSMLHLSFYRDGESEDAYFINTETAKKTVDEIEQGNLELLDLVLKQGEKTDTLALPSVFRLYEENIGILTPMICEELQEAEKLYPADWVAGAFKEAVAVNKRSWKYIVRILERWATEGKDDGKLGRGSEKESHPEKYIRGKYGHMVER